MKYIAVVALFGMIAIALLWINFTYIIPRYCWPKFVK